MSDDLVKRAREWDFCWPSRDIEMLVPAMADRIEELEEAIKEMFVLLERIEQTDEGKTFHPVRIYCTRVLDCEKLNQVLKKLKGEQP